MRILVLPGDGIGPEIVAGAVEVLQAANHKHSLGIELDHDDVGFVSLEKYGTTLRDELLERAKGYDGIILGPQSHMDYPPPARRREYFGQLSRQAGSLCQSPPGPHA
jgi:3-isopropylmalate dehydrogenase